MILVVLMVLTSLALAFTVSVWLVPPYLVLMVWILAPVRSPRDHVPAAADEQGSELVSNDDRRYEPAESGIEFRSQAEPDVATGSPAEAVADQDVDNEPDPVVVKTRRGRGRGRRAKGGTVGEPAAASATWIQVGPGKFVRVEGSDVNANANASVPAEPPVAVPEGDSADPLASALPAVEDAEEPASCEPANEVGPEPEDRPAILEAPAARDESTTDELITDHDLASPDAEALLQRSAEADAWPALEGSSIKDAEESASRELVVEVSPEPEDRPASFDVPAPCDESNQDQGESINDGAFASSSDAEASLRPPSAEVELRPEFAGSTDTDLQLDETWVHDGACEEALAFDEAGAGVEDESDGPAEVMEASAQALLGLEDSELGPVEPSGDQSIALDAPDVDWTTEAEDLLLPKATRVARSPSLRTISSPSRSTGKAPFVSWRGVWPRVGVVAGRVSDARPLGRVGRSGSKARVAPGSRRRSRRGVRAYRLVCRTFPPRSPPVCD